MRKRFAITIAAVLVLAGVLISPAKTSTDTGYVGTYVWNRSEKWFGGFSGIEVYDQGKHFVTVSDRGRIVTGDMRRKNGAIVGIGNIQPFPILNVKGKRMRPRSQDAEGIALGRDGRLHISFEGYHRVWRYDAPGSKAVALPRDRRFKAMQRNSSLEALAIDDLGQLYTLPERSGAKNRPFPIYRFNGRTWSVPLEMSRIDDFLPVGMDFGPYGKLYVLERKFTGVGFRSRVRRFVVTPKGLKNQEILFQTHMGEHDNLEGLSVWKDDDGKIRLTMIADDNFKFFQRTELVEYVVSP